MEQRRIRRGRRRFVLLVAGSGFLGGAVAAVFGVLLADADRPVMKGDPPGWAAVLGGILAVGVLLVEIVVLVRLVRSGWYRQNRESRLWGVSPKRRRQLLRQVRRGEPAPGEDLSLLRHTARQLVNQRRAMPLYVCLPVLAVAQALANFSLFWLALAVLLIGLSAGGLVLMLRDVRRAEAFLRAYPDGVAGSAGGTAGGQTASGMLPG